jgi:putative transposase
LLAVLFAACGRLCSLFAAAGRLLRAPCHETVRLALRAQLPADLPTRQRRLNRALAPPLPRALRRRPQRLAVDLTLIPYHGRPERDPDEWYRGQAKSGASHFHAFATAYLVLRGQRFTLALAYVRQGQKSERVLQGLLQRCAQLGVRPRRLLLDRASGRWGSSATCRRRATRS